MAAFISGFLITAGAWFMYTGIKRLVIARRLCWITNSGLYNYIELGLDGSTVYAYILRDGTFGSRLARNMNLLLQHNPGSDVIKYAKYDDICQPGFNRSRTRKN